MSNQDLDNVLKTFNVDDCIQFFSKMDEKERKALSERALLWNTVSVGCNLSHPEMQWFAQFMNSAPKRVVKMFAQRDEARKLASQLPSEAQKPQAIDVSNIAVFATCGFTEIRKRDAVPKSEATSRLISDRKPRWTPQFAKYALEKNPSQYWDLIRQMERQDGLKLEHDSTYLAGMALGLDRDGLAEILLDDPQLIEEMWRMLDDHAAMSAMLTKSEQRFDQHGIFRSIAGERWKSAICSLVVNETIPKDRVLKSIMSTLTRLALENSDGSASINPIWFIEMHRDLRLELDEHLVHFPDYCTALRSRSDWALRWAIGQVNDLSNAPTVPMEDACVAMSEVFLTKGKENSVLAIDCLKAIAKENEPMHPSVAMCAAEALSHSSSDIQKQAIMLVEKFGDKNNVDLVDRLRQQMDYIAVLNRERLTKWLPADDSTGLDDGSTVADHSTVAGGSTGAGGSTSNVIQLKTASGAKSFTSNSQTDDLKEQVTSLKDAIQDIPENWLRIANVQSGFDAFDGNAIDLESIDFDGTEFPRLDDDKKLKPIQDLDELIFLLSRHCQGGSGSTDADELELMMDAISRLGSERPADFQQRTAPIRLINLNPYDVLKMYIEAWLDKKTNMTRFFEYIVPSATTNSMYLGGVFGMGSSNPIDHTSKQP